MKNKEIKKRLIEIEKEKQDLVKIYDNNSPFIVKVSKRFVNNSISYGIVVLFFTFIMYGAFNKIYGTNISFTLDNIIGIDILIDTLTNIIPDIIGKMINIGYEDPYIGLLSYFILVYLLFFDPFLDSLGEEFKKRRDWKTNYLNIGNMFGLSYHIRENLGFVEQLKGGIKNK